MERALRYELGLVFPNTRIFPTNAPKDAPGEYLIYYRSSTVWDKTLDGFIQGEDINYIINVMAETYEKALEMREKLEQLLRCMLKVYIGENNEVYIKDLELNGVGETYEPQLKKHRGIVDFTVYI